jgi:uncharacterized protein YkwD
MKFLAALILSLAWLPFAHAGDLASQVQAEINLARTAPRQYAQIVAQSAAGRRSIEGDGAVREAIRFLEKAQPLPALGRSPGMDNGALSHVLDIGPAGIRGHTGTDGSTPWKRMERFGRWSGHAAENIAFGLHDARGIVVAWIIDDGVRGRGHRLNIFGPDLRCAGIACGPHAAYGTMCVMDFATAFVDAAPGVAAR